jgi:hypothetical protein
VLSLDVKGPPEQGCDEIVAVRGHRSRSNLIEIDAGSEAMERLTV